MKPVMETWALSPLVNGYAAVPDTDAQRAQLAAIHKMQFRGLSIGGPSGQVAVIPLDESSKERGQLAACAPELARMLLSIFVHVTHGGPTREEAEALLRKAGVL